MTRGVPKRPQDMTEKEWDYSLFAVGNRHAIAPMLGWTSYHTLRSKGSRAGFPDRTLYRDRIIFAELKKHGGKPTDEQVKWLDGLARAGGEVYVWTPLDFDEIGRILGRRWRRRAVPQRIGEEEVSVPVLCFDAEDWTPASIWVPGFGRAENLDRGPTSEQLAIA